MPKSPVPNAPANRHRTSGSHHPRRLRAKPRKQSAQSHMGGRLSGISRSATRRTHVHRRSLRPPLRPRLLQFPALPILDSAASPRGPVRTPVRRLHRLLALNQLVAIPAAVRLVVSLAAIAAVSLPAAARRALKPLLSILIGIAVFLIWVGPDFLSPRGITSSSSTTHWSVTPPATPRPPTGTASRSSSSVSPSASSPCPSSKNSSGAAGLFAG